MTSTARSASPGGVRILDKLRDDGRITAPQYESFFHQAKRNGERIEETILDSGVMNEADLMKIVAAIYQTRFVSTDRLAKADIDRATLEHVPRIDLASPATGITQSGTITYRVTAYDPDAGTVDGAGIARVLVSLWIQRRGQDDHADTSPRRQVASAVLTTPPYELTVDTLAEGLPDDSYGLSVVAVSEEGEHINTAWFPHLIDNRAP